jgi:hypothetical protein
MQPEATADEIVYGGLGRALKSRAPVGRLDGLLGEPQRVAAGIAVYRNNVRAAYLGVLGDTFPVVRRLVGEEFFRFLAHEYFHAQPTTHSLVARYGDGLPDFIESFEPASRTPYLADVARLELAWLAAYHAPEAPALRPAEIFQALGDRPDQASVALHPSVRLVSSRYAIHTIWLRNRQEQVEALVLLTEGERVLLVRPGAAVLTSTVSVPVWTALRALARGEDFSQALNAAVASAPTVSLITLVQEIVATRVISAVTTTQRQGGPN